MRTTKIVAGVGAAAAAQWGATRLLAGMTKRATELETVVVPEQRKPGAESAPERPAS